MTIQEINKLLDTAMAHVDEMVAERQAMIATIEMLRRKLKLAELDKPEVTCH